MSKIENFAVGIAGVVVSIVIVAMSILVIFLAYAVGSEIRQNTREDKKWTVTQGDQTYISVREPYTIHGVLKVKTSEGIVVLSPEKDSISIKEVK